jgi:pimeloyl-ACP methyl ester carboxylesterase
MADRTAIFRSAAGAREVERRYRELLDRWPVDAQRLTVATRFGDTFVMASGPSDAPPVVALQGTGATVAMWLPQIAAWSRRLRVYAVDVIGEPGLSAPARPRLSSGAYPDWLDDVTAGIDLAATAMVGVSLGGWLAADYAARRPGRVTRLALLNPSGIGRTRSRVLLVALLLAPYGERGRSRTMRYALGIAPGAPPPEPGSVASDLGEFALLTSRYFKRRTERIPTISDEALRRLDLPMLAILGRRDVMIDAEQTARRLAANVPSATVRLLPDAGHLLPDQTAMVLDFLAPHGLSRLGGTRTG